MTTPSALAVARAGLWTLIAAHLVTVWGTSWDIRWHLLIGRDSFWIPPHLMTYSGVTAIVLVSFGVLAWTSAQALRGATGAPETIRLIGITGTRGYHLAAYGIALTVLAAPIDDLWHRTFGLDVTLWSPPHLLGLLGGIINSAACWLIACEAYIADSDRRLKVTYPVLAALLAPLALVVTAQVSRLRAAPVLVIAVVFVIGFAGAAVSRVGFAWVQPESFLAEEIAKDPTSPIAVAHEMAAVAYGMTVFVTVSVVLARMPAFAQPLPSVPETVVAAGLTVLAGLAGGLSPSRRQRWCRAPPPTTSAIPCERDRRTKSGRCAP